MKRMHGLVVVLFLMGPICFCQAISLGGYFSSTPELIGDEAGGGDYLQVPVGIGAFFDISSARLFAAVTGAWAEPASAYEFEAGVIAGYAYPLWIVDLVPGVGILYQIPIWGDADGDGVSDLAAYTPEEVHDLYLLIGFSVERAIASQLFVHLSAYWGINMLAPSPQTATVSAPHPALSGNFVTIQIGVGYVLSGPR